MPTVDEQQRQLHAAIDQVYDTVRDQKKWGVFLETTARLFDAQGAQIGHHNLENFNLSFTQIVGYNWDEEHYRRYDALMSEDPRVKNFARTPFKAVHCRMFIDDAALHATEVYKQVLSVGGVEYSLGVNFVEDERTLSYLLILRNATQPRFDQTDCEMLDMLSPHVFRALQMHRDIGTLERERNSVVDALDSLGIGLMVVDDTAEIRFANVQANRTLKSTPGFSRKGGRVALTGENDRLFNASIRQDLDKSVPIHIRRENQQEPLVLVIMPLAESRARFDWLQSHSRLSVVIVRDPEQPIEHRAEILRELFGLTPSEQKIAISLSDGNSLKDAADESGITENSARQYLKSIFRKLDVNRQGDLVRKVLTLPL